MTQTTIRQEQGSAVAERLRAARQSAGLTLDDAAAATGLLRSYLVALETDRRRPLPREVDRLSGAYGEDLSDLLPPRSPVQVDSTTGHMALAGQARRVRDLSDEREVYASYLFLLHVARGARAGDRLALRASDVERLMAVVGEDAVTIERRLVELMGCTPQEASLLGQTLLSHRTTAAAGQSKD